MCSGIIFKITTSYEFTPSEDQEVIFQLFREGFGVEAWQEVVFPISFDEQRCTGVFSTNQVTFLYPSTTSVIYPIPIIGTIIPIMNFDNTERGTWKRSNEYHFKDLHHEIYRAHQPILYLLINNANGEPLGLTPESVREAIRADDVPHWSVLEWDVKTQHLPQLLADRFDLPPDALEITQSPTGVQLPSLNNAVIQPQHLGIGRDAKLGFIHDCLKALVPAKTPFRVWIDAIPTGQIMTDTDREALISSRSPFSLVMEGLLTGEIGTHDNENLIQQTTDHMLTFRAAEDSSISLLAEPHSVYRPVQMDSHRTFRKFIVEPAFHLYLEYEGLVYDGMFSLYEPISTDSYQSGIDSTWRKSIDIMPDMTVDEAMQKVDIVLQMVKMGII